MSETFVPEEIASLISSEYSFNNVPAASGEARNRLEEDTRGVRERLLDLGKNVAIFLKNEGWDFEGNSTELIQQAAAKTWETALDRVQRKLSTEAKVGSWGAVLATINDLDPYIDIEVIGESGNPYTLRARGSVGIKPGMQIKQLEVSTNESIEAALEKEDIVIAGQVFSKKSVFETLTANAHLKPEYGRRYSRVPLTDNSGRLYLIRLETETLKNLHQSLEEVKTDYEVINKTENLKIEFQNLVNEPVVTPELSISKDLEHGRRMIVASNFLFQGRTYGKPIHTSSEDAHRTYFQVELEDIPALVEILKEVGVDRASKGEGLDFKFLLASFKADKIYEVETGVFKSAIEDSDPRVVVYFNSEEERVRFLRDLMANPEYRKDILEMSDKRVDPVKGYKARRPGSHVYYDSINGAEIRAINYTEGGYSEGILEVYGDDAWRKVARGNRTSFISK